ncbi:MAG: NAD(P)H-binding protein [Pseudomonadota bacterium]
MSDATDTPTAPDSTESCRRALVTGATGYAGRAVVRTLLDHGWAVVALVRQLSAEPVVQAALQGAELRVCNLQDGSSLREQGLRGERFDAVFSCIASRSGSQSDAWAVEHDANTVLLGALLDTDTHFVLLSAICVQKPRLAFQHAKLAFEGKLQRSGLRYSIVRPTAFFKSLAGQVERVRRGKPYLMFGNGALTACKPISQEDLAQFMCDCIDDVARHDCILPVGGPGPALTPAQQGQILFDALKKPARFRAVSIKVFDVMITLLSILGALLPALRDKAELARIGRYYATESMLLWDDEAQRYDAAATPEFGTDRLDTYYQRLLEQGLDGQELGSAAVFDRRKRVR